LKLVIIDQLGCYAALLGAAYLTGQIGGQPTRADILQLPAFARPKNLRPGELCDCGIDKLSNHVYTLGVGCEAKIMMVSAADLLNILGARQDIQMIDLSSFNGPSQKVWWYLGLVPFMKEISRQRSAALLEQRFPELQAFLVAELTEAGLEYS